MADCNLENLEAVVKTVLTEGVYSNAGDAAGEIFRKEDYTCLLYTSYKRSEVGYVKARDH